MSEWTSWLDDEVKRSRQPRSKKFKMLVGILMVWWITQRGRWWGRMFTLYISRKSRWKIKWISNEWLVLFIFGWWANIRGVLWKINNGCIHGSRQACEIMDGRFTNDVRKERRGLRRKGVILHQALMLKLPLTLLMNDNACWLCNTNFVSGLFLVHNKWRVWNGWTQDNIIGRNTQVQRQRSYTQMHMRNQRTHNQIFAKIEWSDVGRVWRMNRCVSMILNITGQWWSCWIRGRRWVSWDSAYFHMRFCSSINEECWARLDLKLSLGMGIFLKVVLELVPKIRKFHLARWSLKLQVTEVLQKINMDSCGALPCYNNFRSRWCGSKW